jgi:hypothetical protein
MMPKERRHLKQSDIEVHWTDVGEIESAHGPRRRRMVLVHQGSRSSAGEQCAGHLTRAKERQPDHVSIQTIFFHSKETHSNALRECARALGSRCQTVLVSPIVGPHVVRRLAARGPLF